MKMWKIHKYTERVYLEFDGFVRNSREFHTKQFDL
jgi:hypothetical protein